MDTIHDMGGMQGFGRVEVEPDEPVFHAEWERRVFALLSAAPYVARFSDDHFRPAIERIAPERYLSTSYYEKWLEALTALLAERGLLTMDELQGGPLAPLPAEVTAAMLKASDVVTAIEEGASQARPDDSAVQRFSPGDTIRTKRHGHAGHTRLPRYARGKPGQIATAHGTFLVADCNAVGDRTREHLYTVVFAARDLWGDEARAGDTVTLDLWDRYLEPA